MQFTKLTAVILGAVAFATACELGPTQPDNLQSSFDAVDPVVATFSASQGLPVGAANGQGPDAALPDNLKLSDAQKAQIEALVTAFQAANKTDLDAMKAAMDAARAAKKAGKTHAEVKAILETAKAAAERVHAKGEALRVAIGNVLTAAQKAWLEAHKPDRPPRTP